MLIVIITIGAESDLLCAFGSEETSLFFNFPGIHENKVFAQPCRIYERTFLLLALNLRNLLAVEVEAVIYSRRMGILEHGATLSLSLCMMEYKEI